MLRGTYARVVVQQPGWNADILVASIYFAAGEPQRLQKLRE
jgi:hypothetical protein